MASSGWGAVIAGTFGCADRGYLMSKWPSVDDRLPDEKLLPPFQIVILNLRHRRIQHCPQDERTEDRTYERALLQRKFPRRTRPAHPTLNIPAFSPAISVSVSPADHSEVSVKDAFLDNLELGSIYLRTITWKSEKQSGQRVSISQSPAQDHLRKAEAFCEE
jgi:hypothetical protein